MTKEDWYELSQSTDTGIVRVANDNLGLYERNLITEE